jgi:hypothetical protein
METAMRIRVFAACVLVLLVGVASGQGCVNGTNTALQFDGNDWVRVAAPGSVLSALSDFTIETWFRSTMPGTFQGLLNCWESTTGAGGWYVRLQANGGLAIQMSGSPFTVFGSGWDDGAWHHVAVTRTTSTLSVYVDGAPVSTTTSGAPIPASTADFSMGCTLSGTSPSSLLVGGLDEVRVWNIGRTQTQINSTRFSVLNGNEAGLVGYWRLNEGGGQTAANSASATTGSLNGTLGASAAASIDDPAWSFGSTAPIIQCAPGTGQPNTIVASLRVNGVGDVGVPGPFTVAVDTTGPTANTITLSWQGPANAPLLLVTGSPLPNAGIFPCVGSFDLSLAGFAIAGDFFTSPFPLNYLFLLNGSGVQQTTFTVPAAVLGAPWVSFQGAVYNPACAAIVPYRLTAAFTLQ